MDTTARACRHFVLPLRPHCSACLARVDELDLRLLAERELLQRCELEAQSMALGRPLAVQGP